jgi:hypothetical protein
MGKGPVTIVIAVNPTVIVAWFDFWLVFDPIHLVLPKFPYITVLGKPHFETYNKYHIAGYVSHLYHNWV